MRLTQRLVGLAILAGMVGACAPQPAAPPAAADTTEADLAAIAQVRSTFQAALTNGDAAGIGAVYTEDGVDMAANMPTSDGRASVVAAQEASFSQAKPDSVAVTPINTRVVGDLAVERGTFHLMLTPVAGGDAMTVEGRYLIVLQRQADGSWKVTESMDNSPIAMPSM
jgi:uncharacterized protein (TIGR02246 family)